MAARESVQFDFLSHGASQLAGDFKKTGDSAVLAAKGARLLADAVDKQRRASDASAGATLALAKADKILADAEHVLADGALEADFALKRQAGQARKTAAETAAAGDAAGGAGGGFAGLAGSGGMGAAIAAAVVLSPVIATVATGLAGFGAAAYGVAKPIENAAQKAGGLQANLALLNPEQQKVAQGVLSLGQQFGAFQKQMQPQVFGVFNQGLSLAGHLLHDVQPIAAATGKALGGALSQIDAEFKSQTWQQFFGFMASTAGPDIKLLTDNFTGLLKVLPPLLESLQGPATTILKDTAGLLQLVAAAEKAIETEHRLAQEASSNTGWFGKLASAAGQAFKELVPGAAGARDVANQLGKLAGNSGASGKGLNSAAHAALIAGPKFFSLDKSVALLNTDMTKLVGNLLTLQGSELSWKQALQAAQSQLKSNTAGLEGNSKNALANKQAVLQSTSAALTFASQQLTLGKNIEGASRTVQRQIGWLQGLRDKSSLVKQEIAALRTEEAKLAAQRINQTIHVQGLGQWQVSQSLAPGVGHRRAMGGLIPGAGSGDTYPALLTPGEVVVPKPMVRAGAVDHLRGRLPGFAAGGIVGSYSGSVAGMPPWIRGNDAATVRLVDLAVVKATAAGIKAAQSAAIAAARSAGAARGSGGPPSGAVSALQRYAASLFGQFGWSSSQLGPLIALWNGESGWNPLARNPSSGAFGIPQALPPGKMGALAASGNAAAQIRWGEGYIHSVYGTPGNAYGTWLSRSPHWYGNGLQGGVFTRPTLIGVGERGPERVDVTPVRAKVMPRSSSQQRIVLEIRANDSETTHFLLGILRKAVRTHGGGDVQVTLGRP